MDSFSILQISKQSQSSLESSALSDLIAKLDTLDNYNKVVFETCLRKIYFFKNDNLVTNLGFTHGVSSEFELYTGVGAVAFLLEVLCGLHSRILGETEIFGQFKDFLKKPEFLESFLYSNSAFIRFITETVKEAREAYIRFWGVKSYGSIIRKWAKNEIEVSVFGAGNLTQEILPWLLDKKQVRKIKIYVRSPENYQGLLKTYAGIDILSVYEFANTSSPGANIIVAAPIPTETLLKILPTKARVIDCRGIDNSCTTMKGKISDQIEFLELKDIFSQLEVEQSRSLDRRLQVKVFLSQRAEHFLNREAHRPMGWDDLCA